MLSSNRNVQMEDTVLVEHQPVKSALQVAHALMAPFQSHRQIVLQEHTVLLELVFAMHVLWGHILVLQHHFVHLVRQDTHVTIPVNHHKHVPLQNTGTMVER